MRSDAQHQDSKTALDLGSQMMYTLWDCGEAAAAEDKIRSTESLSGALHKVAQVIRWHTSNCKTWPELLSQSEFVCLDYKIADVVMLHHKRLAHRTYEQILLNRIEIRHKEHFLCF